ncbi:MAG TPA: DUF6285 domain-containing protein [Caulobacteraceae bacterium]
MQDEPKPAEILAAVTAFLKDQVAPQTNGALSFQARVAANALSMMGRQLETASAAEEKEKARLEALLGRPGTLVELNGELALRIAEGRVDLSTPGLKDHLWRTTMAKLAVDQPTYAAYRAALATPDIPRD